MYAFGRISKAEFLFGYPVFVPSETTVIEASLSGNAEDDKTSHHSSRELGTDREDAEQSRPESSPPPSPIPKPIMSPLWKPSKNLLSLRICNNRLR
jgi:hypothetical protein